MATLEEQIKPLATPRVRSVRVLIDVAFDDTGTATLGAAVAYIQIAGESERTVDIDTELTTSNKTYFRTVGKAIRDRITAIRSLT